MTFSNDNGNYGHNDEDKKDSISFLCILRERIWCEEGNQVTLWLPRTTPAAIETIGKSILTTDHS